MVAAGEAERTIQRSLRHLRVACESISHEIVVVARAGEPAAALAREAAPEALVLEAAPDALTPALWAEGMRRSQGAVVALTTGHFAVAPGWAPVLLDAIARGATGAGGPIVLADETSATGAALFYLRYARFLEPPRTGAGGHQVVDLAGDNAAYSASALARHASSWHDGFWEVDFHRRLGSEARLVLMPDAVAAFAAEGVPLRSMMRQRFDHGRHSGAWRVANAIRSRLAVIAAAPVVPALLAMRAARRVLPLSSHRTRFLTALPGFLLLAAAWAAGEAWGALLEPATSRRRAPAV